MQKKNITLIIFCVQCMLSSMALCQSAWTNVPFNFDSDQYSTKTLFDVNFSDSLHGWVLGAQGVYKTEDGGLTWNKMYHQRYFRTPHNKTSIAFAKIDTCYFFNRNILFRSYDNGISWDSTEIEMGLSACFFLDDSTGWGCASDFKIYKTTDRGNSWNIKYSDSSESVRKRFFSICFPSPKRGFITGQWGNIYHSSDAGETWLKQKINDGTLFSIYFLDSTTGWTVGYDGAILATTDGGATWNHLESNTKTTLNDIIFTDYNTGIAIGNRGEILHTLDGGNKWIDNSINSFMDFYSIDFVGKNLGWIVGGKESDSSVIFKTVSGGIVSSFDNPKIIENLYYLSQNYPNPFNPTTTIRYSIPSPVISDPLGNERSPNNNEISHPPSWTRNDKTNVELVVFDILGRQVKSLVNENQNPGNYSVEFDGSDLISGVYFYRLKSNDKIITKKMVLLK